MIPTAKTGKYGENKSVIAMTGEWKIPNARTEKNEITRAKLDMFPTIAQCVALYWSVLDVVLVFLASRVSLGWGKFLREGRKTPDVIYLPWYIIRWAARNSYQGSRNRRIKR